MSRDKILNAIRKNKSGENPLPEPPKFAAPTADLLKAFTLVSESSGSNVRMLEDRALITVIEKEYPDAKSLFSTVPGLPSRHLPEGYEKDPHLLREVDLTIIPARLGVAENGALWVTEAETGPRVSPFIAQHLVVVLPREAIVWNMHEAYQRIKIDETGFGVFIAGPSKTADIEQSLVIGAQAARSLTVIIS